MSDTNGNVSGLADASEGRWSRKRTLTNPPVFNGLGNSYEDKNNDFLCPICFNVIDEACITKCGHSFCYKCIKRSLDQNNRCPKCTSVVKSKDHIYPNVLLNELILKHKQQLEIKRMKMDTNYQGLAELREFFAQESDNINLADVNRMLEFLAHKKQQLETDCKLAQLELLREFLQDVRAHKRQQLQELTNEISLIDKDMARVETQLQSSRQKNSLLIINPPNDYSPCTSNTQEGFNGSKNGARRQEHQMGTSNRKKRMHAHFDDLEQCYFSIRSKELDISNSTDNGLQEFQESLAKFTRYSTMRSLATLNYTNDLFNSSSIVSSIEFDKDNEFFAIAGIFDYGIVVRDIVDIHYPCNEMVCNSKISCVSWSSYHKNMLASSDYEGTVTIWDASTKQKIQMFQEHEKRCWSVDFNHVDTKLVASGSDDAKVKLWATNLENSITSIEAKANVCCVKFNPQSKFHLAFGSADHCVHYYDLRNPRQPLAVFKGHRKAVSYAKFLNPEEIVTASTDSQLKLWNVNKNNCLKSFKGHTNEKNFVGLATDGDYIVCGSENNSLYIYYKGLSKQLLSFKFDTIRNVLEKEKKDEDANEFVSAVCWKQGSNVVVAANSQGTIKVLELI
uniref:RING-type domain-containing protein n=1 Tax=Strigamia maritima TaxID=126957 RepID=T1JKE0_STRMM